MTADQPLPALLTAIVDSVHEAFGLTSVSLLLPEGDGFTVAAQAGEPMTDDELRVVFPAAGGPRSLRGVMTQSGPLFGIRRRRRSADRRVVPSGKEIPSGDLGSLRTFANQAALAVERARLREQTVQTELLRRVDGWRSALLGAFRTIPYLKPIYQIMKKKELEQYLQKFLQQPQSMIPMCFKKWLEE